MLRPINLLVVIGLAAGAGPASARAAVGGGQGAQQGDTLRQHGESHRESPHRELMHEATVDDCDLDAPQAPGGPTPQEQEAKRRAQKWWLSEESRHEFAISDQQSKDLEAVFQSLLPQLRANKADLDKQEKVLSQLLNEANSNEALVLQAIDGVEAARGALSRTRTLMLYRMYRLLSADQRAKVQAYHERKAQENDNRTAQR